MKSLDLGEDMVQSYLSPSPKIKPSSIDHIQTLVWLLLAASIEHSVFAVNQLQSLLMVR
jgi:hypothetical protein